MDRDFVFEPTPGEHPIIDLKRPDGSCILPAGSDIGRLAVGADYVDAKSGLKQK